MEPRLARLFVLDCVNLAHLLVLDRAKSGLTVVLC